MSVPQNQPALVSVPQNQPVFVFNKLIGLGVLFLGLAGLIAALSMFLYAAESAGKPLVEAPPPTKLGFQLVQLGEFRRDHFLVDGDSGNVWNRVCSGKVTDGECDGTLVWEQMCVESVGGEKNFVKCYAVSLEAQ